MNETLRRFAMAAILPLMMALALALIPGAAWAAEDGEDIVGDAAAAAVVTQGAEDEDAVAEDVQPAEQAEPVAEEPAAEEPAEVADGADANAAVEIDEAAAAIDDESPVGGDVVEAAPFDSATETASEDQATQEPAATGAPANEEAAPVASAQRVGAKVDPEPDETTADDAADDAAKHPLADGTYLFTWAKSGK